MPTYEVRVTETNVGYITVEANDPDHAAQVAEDTIAEAIDWEPLVVWDAIDMEYDPGVPA